MNKLKKMLYIFIFAGFLMSGIPYAQSGDIFITATYNLTTCAQVTNLNGVANAGYEVMAPISCPGPIVINLPSTSYLTFGPQGSLYSSTGTATINGVMVSTSCGPITSTAGCTQPITGTGTITTTGTGTFVAAIPAPVKANLYAYDYDTGGALRPTTRNIGMILSLESKVMDPSNTFTSLPISSFSATDFKGKSVNLMLPSALVLDSAFNGMVYGEQKSVFGPFLARPLSQNVINGGLVINLVLHVGGANISISTTASFSN